MKERNNKNQKTIYKQHSTKCEIKQSQSSSLLSGSVIRNTLSSSSLDSENLSWVFSLSHSIQHNLFGGLNFGFYILSKDVVD